MTLTKSKLDFLIIFFGKILQVVIVIVSIKVMTHLLNPSEIGKIYLFTTIYTFFVLFFISPIGQYVNRKTHQWYKNKMLFNNLLIYILYMIAISLFSAIVSLFLYNIGIITLFDKTILLILVFSFVFIITLNQTILPLLNMLHHRLSFTILTLVTSLFIVINGYIFIIYLGALATNWLYGILLSNLFFTLIGFIILIKKEKMNSQKFYINIDFTNLKSIFNFILPLSIATLFMWVQNSGYRMMLEHNLGLEFLGYFGVGMAISAQVASTVESIAMQYFHPIYYQQITDTTLENRKKAIDIFLNKVLPIYLMLSIFIMFVAKYLVVILVDEKYHSVYLFTVFGIWIEFFRMASNLLGNISQSEMQTNKFILPYIVGALSSISLVSLISFYGYIELITTVLLISGMITFIIMYINMKKLINFYIDYKLLVYALLMSLPYVGILLFDVEATMLNSMIIILGFGLYFLISVAYLYREKIV